MQGIKVIKIKRITVKILLLICILFLIANLGFIIYKKAFLQETITAFNEQRQIQVFEYIKAFDNRFFEFIFSQTIPSYEVLIEKAQLDKKTGNRSNTSITGSILKLALNINSFSGKDIINYQMPILGQIRLEAASTPGVEIDGNSENENSPSLEQIPENEHEPENEENKSLPPPEVKPEQIEEVVPVKGAPIVLIYHTHTTESYMPSKAYNYKPRDKAYHSDDLNFTVVKVGEILKKELENYGIKVLHDKTVHDVPTYMYSYSNSLNTVQGLLKKYPTLQILIDLHRDAPYSDPDKSRELTTVKINGKLYSRIMLVVGTDKMFPHPNWKENYKFALLIQEKMEELFPGLGRDIDLREQRFNQHLSKKAILVEIGSHGNTMEESIESAKAFAKVLNEVIKSLSKKS